jgi:hypothetical protein
MHERITIDSHIDAGMLLIVKNDDDSVARFEFIIGVGCDQKVFHELIIPICPDNGLNWWLETFNYHPADPYYDDAADVIFNLR